MSFGEKVKKETTPEFHDYEKDKELVKIEKTACISFHITGPNVDLIDWHTVIQNELSNPDTITSGNVNIYYTKKKE